MVMNVVLRKAFQNRSMVPKAPTTWSPLPKMSVKFVNPTNFSPPATRPVVGSTPVLVWKNDSRIDMTTGMPATTMMIEERRSEQHPGQPALAIAQRVLLVLVAVSTDGRTPWFRSGSCHAVTSFAERHRVPARNCTPCRELVSRDPY